MQDTQQRAGLLLNIGDLYLAMAKPDKAFENFDKAHDIGVAINDKNFQIQSLTGIGKTYRAKKDYQRAIDHFGFALKICDSTNEFAEEVKILNELANTYLETWVFPMALTFADSDHSESEDRSRTYGVSNKGRLLVVDHTERRNNVRIISARKATRYEKDIYEQG